MPSAPNLYISEHFQLGEFAQPARFGCKLESYPDELIFKWLVVLCEDILEPIRASFDRPIQVISGWRSKAYNDGLYKATGRIATDSQHSYGRAADFIVEGIHPGTVHTRILELWRARKLLSLGGLGKYHGFTHVDIRPHEKFKLSKWSGRRTLEQTA